MDFDFITLAIAAFVVVVLTGAFLTCIYKKPETASHMLVINGLRGVRVTRTGAFVKPIIDTVEELATSDKIIYIERTGEEGANGEDKRGLSCQDGVRVDLKVGFYISLPQKEDQIKALISQIEVKTLNNLEALTNYLHSKFSEILKDSVAKYDYETLLTSRDVFKEEVKRGLTGHLSGLLLEDVAIDEIHHSKLESHDATNINDAAGIRKITEITEAKRVETASLSAKAATEIKEQTEGAKTAQDRIEQQEEAEREQLKRNKNEETNKTAREKARLEQEAEQEKSLRAVSQNKEKVSKELESKGVLAEESAKVERRAKLAQIDTQSAAEQHKQREQIKIANAEGEASIAEEKAKLETARVVAERVDVERDTEAQNQSTLDLIANKTAERLKVQRVGEAEATAKAEATAVEIAAETKLQVTEKEVKAKAAQAQGDTIVSEESKKQMLAQAEGQQAVEAAEGLAKAEVTKAEGLAKAEVTKAEGLAEADVEKARREVMDVDPEIREHEVRLLQIQNSLTVELEKIIRGSEATIAQSNALSNAYQNADIKLVGSNGDFADRFLSGVEQREVASLKPIVGNLVSKYADENEDVLQDVLSSLSENQGSAKDMLVMELLKKVSGNSDISELISGLRK